MRNKNRTFVSKGLFSSCLRYLRVISCLIVAVHSIVSVSLGTLDRLLRCCAENYLSHATASTPPLRALLPPALLWELSESSIPL